MEQKGKHRLGWLIVIIITFILVTLLIKNTPGGIKIFWHLHVVPLIIAALVYDIPGGVIMGFLSSISIMFWLYYPIYRLRDLPILFERVLKMGLYNWEKEIGLGTILFLGVGIILARISQRNKQQRSMLEELSVRDRLTGLFNYSYFIDQLEKEKIRADRYNSKLSIIIVDLDHFKKLNDTYGHETGNMVLKSVAKTFSSLIRNIDISARYGGEEFVFILPNTGEEQSVAIAERIRRNIEQADFVDLDPDDIKLTISCGVASYPDYAADTSQLIYRADEAMYKAKNSGRNNVHAFSELAPPQAEKNLSPVEEYPAGIEVTSDRQM